ncbi:MAG: MFS transporter [Candidatus Levybacteria bacterium]|nr:MFS transporter [Candidatus Levybacteria bacterium]
MKYSIIDALRVKPFAYLMSAELFTQLGANIFNFYLILVVFSLTSSNIAVAGIVLSFTIPAILFGVPAGVYVDRWEKKRVLFLSNFIRAFLLIFLAFFHQNLLIIFVISFLIAVLTQFFIPAESPIIPLIVPQKLLLSANALFGLGIYGSMLIAFILSGPIIILFGQVKTLLLLACMFFASCFFLWLMMVPTRTSKNHKGVGKVTKAMVEEIRDVVRLLSNTKEVHHSLFLLALSQVLILLIASLAPGYATSVLKVTVESFPILFIAPAACGVFIGAISVSLLQKVKRDKIITIGLFLSGAAMLILPYGSRIAAKDVIITINQYLPLFLNVTIHHIVTLLAFLLGFSNAFVFVPSNTILQEKTSDEVRGKVYGVLNTIVGIFSLLPLIIAGWLSDVLGVAAVIVGIGITLLGLGIFRVIFKV